jgi:LysR family transcriptional regulator for metE and metH
MELTPAGKRLLSAAHLILSELQVAGNELSAMKGGSSGLLRISTECTTCYHWLPAVLAAFNRKHPAVEVEINIEATWHPFEALFAGELDVAIVCSTRHDRRLDFRRLFRDEWVIIVNPKHRLASKRSLVPTDFEGETLLYYGGVDDRSMLAADVLAPAGVKLKKLMKVPLTEAIVEMVKAGQGISMVPNWSAQPYVKAGALKVLRLNRAGMFRDWKLTMLRSRTVPDYVDDFAEMLSNHSRPAKVWHASKGA